MNRLIKGMICVAVCASAVVQSARADFPMRIDIDVSAKSSMKNIGAGAEGEAKVERVQVRVKIRKSSGPDSKEPLKLELYVIGKQIHTGYYGVVDVVKEDFMLDRAKNDNTYEFTSKMYPFGKTSGNINVGATYETYLVVVTDSSGKIIETRSGRVIKEKGIAFIRELGPMTLFDRDGNVIGKVENPGEAFKAAVPTATDPGTNN